MRKRSGAESHVLPAASNGAVANNPFVTRPQDFFSASISAPPVPTKKEEFITKFRAVYPENQNIEKVEAANPNNGEFLQLLEKACENSPAEALNQQIKHILDELGWVGDNNQLKEDIVGCFPRSGPAPR